MNVRKLSGLHFYLLFQINFQRHEATFHYATSIPIPH
jgi:hypothetical protein